MDTIGRELNPEERAVLIVLTQDGRTSHHRTSSGCGDGTQATPSTSPPSSEGRNGMA
jgi:hypothetical protein